MINTEDLFFTANTLGINVEFKDLRKKNPNLYGMANANTKTITLDESLLDNQRKLKCIFAEEIGHILSPPRPGHIAFHSTGYINMDYYTRCNVNAIVAQDERRALLWATNFLIPDDEFWRANKSGANTVHLLAELFDVEEWFVLLKINFIRRQARYSGKIIKWRDIISRNQTKTSPN